MPGLSRTEAIAHTLRQLGTACMGLAALCLLATLLLVKLAPQVPTFGLGGALLFFVGGALGPGRGSPMLLTGRMRVSAGLLGLVTGRVGAQAPVAEGLPVRLMGSLFSFAGIGAMVLGGGIVWSALSRGLG